MVLVYHVKLISSTINHYKTIWYSIINKFVQMKINVRQWRRSEGLFHQACRTTICLAAGRTSLTALALTLAVFRSGRETRRRRPDLPVFAGAVPHHLRVDGARDAVVQLGVQLGQLELCKSKFHVVSLIPKCYFFCLDHEISSYTNGIRSWNINHQAIDQFGS